MDISLLSKVLASQDEVMEPDEQWEFNTLFVQVTSELQLELEREEEIKRKEEEEKEEAQNNSANNNSSTTAKNATKSANKGAK